MRLLSLALICACLAAPVLSSQSPVGAAPTGFLSDPKYLAAMSEGKKLTAERQYLYAMNAYKKANKIAGGRDAASARPIYDLQMATGSYKDAAKTATELGELATTPKEKAAALINLGQAYFEQAGEKGKPDLLHSADDALKGAIAQEPKNGTARFFDGKVLAKLGQMEAAQTQFHECLSCITPKDPAYTRVQHFAANPALATAKMAPVFSVTALDGTKFNLDDMGGRVVLIDFWATWCGPCNRELPHIKRLAKEFAGQPLVIISVSWDADESKWKDFIAKNEMTWVQYRDADHSLSKTFSVNAIPHYFTIDSDGVLTAELLGEDTDVEGKLKKLVAKAKAAGAQNSVIASGR